MNADSASGLSGVRMPRLGSSMRSGVVTRWLRAEGDQVSEGEPLVEISTDKVDAEVAAPVSGRLQRIVVAAEEDVAVGTVIGWIEASSG